MSERNYWDEESFQKYKADLIRQRNELNPITDSYYIKFVDKEIENLPDHYLESQFDFKKSEQVPVDDFQKKTRTNFKEKISNLLGNLGCVLVAIIRLIIATLPFVMIGGNFFRFFILTTIESFFPITTIVFWIWGLVCAIKGVQDIWAVLFYIAFALIWIPFFISTIISMFSKK